MHLNKRNRKTIGILHADARITLKALGARLHIAKESASYRVKQLQKKGLITEFSIAANCAKIGYEYFMIVLKFSQLSPTKEEDILDFLLSIEGVAQIRSMEGTHNLTFIFMCKQRSQLRSFLNEFAEQHGHKIESREISLVGALHHLTHGYFLPEENSFLSYSLFNQKQIPIDKQDTLLLASLSYDSRKPLLQIAKESDIDRTTLRYRLQKLQKKGVIIAYTAHIDYVCLGFLCSYLSITLNKSSDRAELISFFQELGICTTIYETIGEYDIVFELLFENAEERLQIIMQFRERFADRLLKYDFSTVTAMFEGGWNPFTLNE